MGILDEVPIVTNGEIRELTPDEKGNSRYIYVVLKPYKLRCGEYEINIPRGFKTDGSSGGPDVGQSWMFHDYLYAAHKFSSGQECKREDADEVMEKILKNERLFIYRWVFKYLAKLNPFYKFSRAWDGSGRRGVKILKLDD